MVALVWKTGSKYLHKVNILIYYVHIATKYVHMCIKGDVRMY